MPKYISRNQFEQMKVLKRRGSSNVAVGKALGMSPATVSRNLRYNSYEDYLVSMYRRNSKSQKEVETKSGPVTVTKKVCSKCGETKPLEEFDKDKNGKDGIKSFCKECRRKKQREYSKVKAARKAQSRTQGCVMEVPFGHVAVCPTSCPRPALPWFDETEDKDEDDEIKINECVYVDINDKVKRGVVIAISNANYNPEYIVRLDTWFSRKEVRVNQYHIFRRDEA